MCRTAVVKQFLTGNARQAIRHALGLAPLPHDGGIERAVSMLRRIRDKQCIQVCRSGGTQRPNSRTPSLVHDHSITGNTSDEVP